MGLSVSMGDGSLLPPGIVGEKHKQADRRWAYAWLRAGGLATLDALAGAYGPPDLPAAAEARERRWVRLEPVAETERTEADWAQVQRLAGAP